MRNGFAGCLLVSDRTPCWTLCAAKQDLESQLKWFAIFGVRTRPPMIASTGAQLRGGALKPQTTRRVHWCQCSVSSVTICG